MNCSFTRTAFVALTVLACGPQVSPAWAGIEVQVAAVRTRPTPRPLPPAEEHLWAAIVSDDAELVAASLKEGARLGSREPETKLPPLLFAAKLGKLNSVKKLLEMGADIEQDNGINREDAHQVGGMTAILYAAQSGHTEVCRYLIEKGAETVVNGIKPWNEAYRPYRAIGFALDSGNVETYKVFLEYELSRELSKIRFPNLLYDAMAIKEFIPIADSIFEKHRQWNDPEQQNAAAWSDLTRNAVIGCIDRDHVEGLEYLVSHGADLFDGKYDEGDLKKYAARTSKFRVVEYLNTLTPQAAAIRKRFAQQEKQFLADFNKGVLAQKLAERRKAEQAEKQESERISREYALVFDFLRKNEFGKAIAQLRKLETSVGVPISDVVEKDIDAIRSGKVEKGEIVIVRGEVLQALSGGFLFQLDHGPLIRVHGAARVVDDQYLCLFCKYRGIGNYVSAAGTRKTVHEFSLMRVNPELNP